MEEQLIVLVDPWQDKYERLFEAHEKLQKLNQRLEDKLLKQSEERQSEKIQSSVQIQDLTQRLVEARFCIHQLEDENERYRNDINVVIQLLHCKPTNFISPKIDTLPPDLQRKVLGQNNSSGLNRKEKKIIKVQIPTLPPTDIMYAVDSGGQGYNQRTGGKDIVSAAIMAKVLQERENERKENWKNCCHCASRNILPTLQKETQTLPSCTISYSDFPYTDESSNKILPNMNSVDNNNHQRYNIFNSFMGETPRNGSSGGGDESMSRDFDRWNHNESSSTHHHEPFLCRETSFVNPQSCSFSSSSSPASTTTSNSYSSSTHHPPEGSNRSHRQSGDLLDMTSSPTSSGNGLLKMDKNISPTEGKRISPPGIYPAFMKPAAAGDQKKMAGHCVRVVDDTEHQSLYNDLTASSQSNGSLLNGTQGSHWRNTVLVQPPPKSHSCHDSLSWFMTVSPPPLRSSTSGSGSGSGSNSNALTSAATTSSSSSANESPSGNLDPLDTASSTVSTTTSSSSSSVTAPPATHNHHHHHQSSETYSSQQNVNPLSSYYGLSQHKNDSILPFALSSQQAHQAHQYYRAQKRTFWTRSSSTTSTETEI